MGLKDKVQLLALEKAFKSVDNFKEEKQIHEAYIYILEKATSMINMTIFRLSNKENLTDKKKKRELGKIKLNNRIKKYVDKNRDLLEKNPKVKELIVSYQVSSKELKEILSL